MGLSFSQNCAKIMECKLRENYLIMRKEHFPSAKIEKRSVGCRIARQGYLRDFQSFSQRNPPQNVYGLRSPSLCKLAPNFLRGTGIYCQTAQHRKNDIGKNPKHTRELTLFPLVTAPKLVTEIFSQLLSLSPHFCVYVFSSHTRAPHILNLVR